MVSLLRDFGEVKINHAHMDFLEGITIDGLSFTGTSEDTLGKSLTIPKIVLKHSYQSLLKGQLNIKNASIISPELTVEKPSDIWSLLNTIKANFDKMEMPLYVDALRNGIEIRDLKLHIKEDKQTNSPEIKLSGIDITFSPYAGSFQDITIKGNIDDEFLGNYTFSMRLYPDIPRLDIEAYAKNLMVDEALFNRFPYIGKMLWDDYKPIGKVNVSCSASFNNQNNQKKIDYLVNVHLNGLKALYEDWPFLIYDLSGDVIINQEKLYLRDVVGYIKSGNYTSQAEFKGEFDLYGSKKTFVMNIPNLLVNQEFLNNIPDIGERVWSKIQPTGLVDITFQYNEGENKETTHFLVVDCKGLKIRSQDFPLPISYMNGQFKIASNIILFKNVSGFIECGDQSVFTEMNGVYDLKNGRKIFNFHVPNLFITKAFLKGLPGNDVGKRLWESLNPHGRAELIANYQGFKEKRDDDYLVEINLKDCEIFATKYKIPVWGIEGRLELNKRRLESKHIDAKCFGGHLEGSISVNIDTDSYKYNGELSITRVNIEELMYSVAQAEQPWSGLLSGRIRYGGRGADPGNFYAEGQVNVSDGYLSDVPIILSVLNFLNLSLPKKESFHSAQAKFSVNHSIVHIDNGRIYSDTFELNGRGNISFQGNLHIDIVAGFSKDFFSRLPIVGRFFDFVVGGVRKRLTMMEVKGTFLNPEVHSVAFKPITRSIKSMFDLLPTDKHDTHKKSGSKGE